MKNIFRTLLFVLAAITAMPGKSIAAQYDGVWEGELISTSKYCGFKKQKVKLISKDNKVTGAWKDAKRKSIKLNGNITGGNFSIKGRRWALEHNLRIETDAIIRGEISDEKISGNLRAVHVWGRVCTANFTLVNRDMVKAAEESALKEQAKLKKAKAELKSKQEAESLVAEKRVALVFGNGAYPKFGILENPPNDARLMAKTLRQVGFDVIERIDADQKVMKKAVKEFGQMLQDAGNNSVGLFYYAGHGVQVGGVNYLIPVNVDINDEADVSIEAVSANDVQGQMAYAGSRLNIIIMDACRNNPFKRSFRSATRGLARMDATKGTLIAYATGPGDVAADGSGINSPYTKALSKNILMPGITVERMFKLVRNEVVDATNSKQVPWESSSLTGRDFYFKGSASTTSQVQKEGDANIDKETMFWDSIKDSSDAADYQAYLKQYPNGSFAALARVRQRKYVK